MFKNFEYIMIIGWKVKDEFCWLMDTDRVAEYLYRLVLGEKCSEIQVLLNMPHMIVSS
jgi:hypothetical protein